MAIKVAVLVLVSLGVTYVAWAISSETGPKGGDSPTQEMVDCNRQENQRALQEAARTGVLEFDDEACRRYGNWMQEHAALTGLIAGSAVFVVGSIVLLLLSVDRVQRRT